MPTLAGAISRGGLEIGAQQRAVQARASAPTLRAHEAIRLMLLGGAPLDGERNLGWNFVASTRERAGQG